MGRPAVVRPLVVSACIQALFGSRPIHDPDWEPYRPVVKLRLAASELNELNWLCLEHGVSRALSLRRAMERGLPPAVDSLDLARSAGMSLRTGRPIRTLQTTWYGPRTLQPITAVFGPESPGQRLNRRSLRYPVPEECSCSVLRWVRRGPGTGRSRAGNGPAGGRPAARR